MRSAHFALVVGIVAWCSSSRCALAQACHSEPVSTSIYGYTLWGASSSPSMSADGRFVAFDSTSFWVVPGDTNNRSDVFVRDLWLEITTRVSVASGGAQSNGGTYGAQFPAISGNGRYVAFISDADDLVPGDTNGVVDVFVHDILTRETERVSVDSSGAEGNGPSGQFLFPSGHVSTMQATGVALSFDGRFIAFASAAGNLAPPYGSGGCEVYVHDRLLHTTIRASTSSDGRPANGLSMHPAITPDGRYVAFTSFADNLVDADTNAGALHIGAETIITGADVFVRDLARGKTERASVGPNGTQANEPCGFYYLGIAGGYEGLSYFVVLGKPSISDDGRFVAFSSLADNLVSGDTNHAADVFVRDRAEATTRRVNVRPDGSQTTAATRPAISGDGRSIAFLCNDALDLAHGRGGIFRMELGTHDATLVSLNANGSAASGILDTIALSTSGRNSAWVSSVHIYRGEYNTANVFVTSCP
jgi:Tol biopolymer transport system component